MSYLTLKIEDGDLLLNSDNQLVLTDDVAQEYKVLIETQFESDYRDGNYGFKLYELMESEYDDKLQLIRLYVVECIFQHSRTESITELTIEKIEEENVRDSRKYLVNVTVKLKSETTISVGATING